MDNICLIGFMGTGKSSVAGEIAEKYNKAHIELDSVIEKIEGMGIPQIFETYGEDYFRGLETQALRGLKCNGAVISCGGGIVVRRENIALLKEKGKVIWLKAKPETIYERISSESGRPLLKGNMTIGYIENMLKSRLESYEAAADEYIYTDKMSIVEIAGYICEKN